MLYQTKRKSGGFVGVVFLAIALIGIVIAAISAMSRSSASGTASETTRTNVAVLLKQASDFKIGFDRMVVSGNSPSSITFDNTVGTGLFDPTPGAQYSVQHLPPAAITRSITASAATFYAAKDIQMPGIGDPTLPEYAVTAVIKDLASCQMINKILYNDLTTATPATSAGNEASWTGTPGAVDDSASVAVNYAGRPEGCITTGGSSYIYYKALSEN